MADEKRLGRGLGAIFGDDVSNVLDGIQEGGEGDVGGVKTMLNVRDIRVNPYQPRRDFDIEKIQELAKSIDQHGLFTPILVRETNKGYELVAGERRLRATKELEHDEIAAIVVDFDDDQMMEIALIENVQREDLNVIEEAMGYQTLIKRMDLTQEEVAKKVSKSRSHITNLLRLLRLPDSVKQLVSDGKLTMGHVRPLVMLEDEDDIKYFAKEIMNNNLSVRKTEKMIKDYLNPKEELEDEPVEKEHKEYKYAVSLFEDKLQTRTEIKNKKLTIHFEDDDDLNRIMELLDIIE